MCLKCQKSGRKLEMLFREEKSVEGMEAAGNLFRPPLGDFHRPLKISLLPLGRNPETAPATISTG